MFIEQLELENFKSFKRARIVFPERIVAITGPNGSGKSNILDAITFVLGERAKALRADRIAGLVRKGADTARVTMILRKGNERIKISREIKKNGTSVYRVNGSVKKAYEVDILLSELGIRAGSYSIVSQGDITEIVEMSPHQRVRLLEEISGVEEYERRKLDALRELEEVDRMVSEREAVLRERKMELDRAERELKKLKELEELNERKNRLIKTVLLKRRDELLKKKEGLRFSIENNLDERIEKVKKLLEMEEKELEDLEKCIEEDKSRELRIRLESMKAELRRIELEISLKEEKASRIKKDIPEEIESDPSFLGTVSDLIKPMEGYELAFHAAIGGRVNDVVIDTYESAIRIVDKLKGRKVRIRIIPLDSIRVRQREEDPEIGLGWLSSYLIYDKKLEKLVHLLLGDYVLVENIKEVQKDKIGRFRYVSLDGEIIFQDGTFMIDRRDYQSEYKAEKELKELIERKENLRKDISELEEKVEKEEKKDILSALKKKREEVRRLRDEYSSLLAERQRIAREMERISEERGILEAELKEVEKKLQELYGYEPAESDDPERELNAIEMRIREIGQVNPNAEIEYRERLSRYESLLRDLEDVKKKRDEVRAAIKKIDEEREKVLSSSFNTLRKAFDEKIREIMGGSGNIRLVEADGRMSLIIEVELPGKKQVPIDSLSGGEKSLVALSFILAAQEVRPSSIYLFDEADFMLDGNNCIKFAEAMKKLSEKAQVIIITLKKETLNEMSSIVGVTRKGDESKVVAVSLQEVS